MPRLLIVDDEPSLLQLTAAILQTYGYETITADRGTEALKILARESVDLVFTDVVMPEMDGYELAAQISERYPDMKIQLASGFTDQYHSEYIDSALHQKLLVKPFTSVSLLRRIRSELEREA